MDVTTIREAIASELSTLDLNTYAFWPDSPAVPCAIVAPETVEYQPAFGGLVNRATFTVTVLAGLVSDSQAQQVVDGWISDSASTSVPGVLLAATGSELGSFVSAVTLRSYGAVQSGEVRYLGAVFEVDVFAG